MGFKAQKTKQQTNWYNIKQFLFKPLKALLLQEKAKKFTYNDGGDFIIILVKK